MYRLRQFFREIASWKFETQDEKLGGVGHVVQVDESVIYRVKYHRGHGLFEPTKWMFGMWDVTSKVGAVFFVPDRSAETLLPLIQQHINPGTEIHSDKWRAYLKIPLIDVQPRYMHRTVNHSLFFKDIETGVHTNNVEAYWSSIKRVFKKLNGTSRAKTASYLDLHMYKERFGRAPKMLFG
jgi:transposase-like protein